jgi:hypothetical protein
MKWFEEVFLPSLFQQKKMVHGKVCTYLTEKQANICRKYMTERICNGDYGQFGIFEHTFNGNKIQLCESGRYTILYW